jgi:hypothetical protein
MKIASFCVDLEGRAKPLDLVKMIDEMEQERMAKIQQPPTIVTPPGGQPAPIAKPGPPPHRPK